MIYDLIHIKGAKFRPFKPHLMRIILIILHYLCTAFEVSTDYWAGRLSDLIFSIFLFIRISVFFFI